MKLSKRVIEQATKLEQASEEGAKLNRKQRRLLNAVIRVQTKGDNP